MRTKQARLTKKNYGIRLVPESTRSHYHKHHCTNIGTQISANYFKFRKFLNNWLIIQDEVARMKDQQYILQPILPNIFIFSILIEGYLVKFS